MSHSPRLLVTGASGALGRLVVEALLERVEPSRVVAAVRDPAKLADLAARGVEVRAADYEQPATLAAAFAGIDRLLLISSNAVGQRQPQHANVIAAAKDAGVGLIAYTSILHADRSPWVWPSSMCRPRRCWRTRASPSRFCAIPGIWKITSG